MKIYLKSLKICLSCLFLFFGAPQIQAQNFEWAKSMGGISDIDLISSIAIDSLGFVYSTGTYTGTVDFDPGTGVFNLTAAGASDIFIQKLDSLGNFVWAKSMGGGPGTSDYGLSITVDPAGYVITTGYFQGSVDFDPGTGTTMLNSNGNRDIFIQKLDSNGNLVWVISIGGSFIDYGQSIQADNLGNVYLTGFFHGFCDFDPGPNAMFLSSKGNRDIFVLKLSSLGNLVWAKSFGGNDWDQGNSINLDSQGNVYTSGFFSGTADFDPDTGSTILTSSGSTDVFIQKLNSAGNFVWAKSFGGTSQDQGLSSSLDESGNIYTTGFYSGTTDFDPGNSTYNLSSAGNQDIFIQKLDTNGNLVWAKSLGGISLDNANSIAVDHKNDIYLTGRFDFIADLDPGLGTYNLTAIGLADIFIMKLNSSGHFLWANSYGSSSQDMGNSIKIDPSGNIYTAGYFNSTIDFNPGPSINNLSSNGNKDFFIQKLSQCSSMNIDSIMACNRFRWIDGNIYTSSNHSATYTLSSTNGCDSIVMLDLTIDTVDTSVNNSSPSLTANATNASFQWLDCNANFALIPGDTNANFIATQNGSYAVQVAQNNCIDTSACQQVINVSILENPFGEGLKIYPNPSPGHFSIDLGEVYSNIQVRITDINGRIVRSQFFSNIQEIQLSIDEATGLYLAKIQVGEKTAVIRLIKTP